MFNPEHKSALIKGGTHMSDVFTILPAAVEGQQAFIFDHGKTVDGALKYQDDITSYSWNTKQFNRVKVGAFVLNRHPGKITKDRKFEIYGGGYVEKIDPIDDQGNVVATISHAFVIEPPIKQGDSFIENFQWDSKTKKPDSWEHFWNQYGMNTISFTDFQNLMASARCVPIGENIGGTSEKDFSEEEVKELADTSARCFNITFEDDGLTHVKRTKKRTGVGRKIDWKKVQSSKDKTAALGEEIVMDILTEDAKEKGLKMPVHVSKEEGDGTGYDIRAWDEKGNEVHVEVKASKDRYADGFEMSRNEIEVSKDPNYTYLIYRVYNLNAKTRECSIKVYEGPVTDEAFKLEATKIAVYQK